MTKHDSHTPDREFEMRVGTIKPGKGSKSDQIRKAVLRELKVEGAIRPQGKGRGAKWIVEK